MAEDFKQNTYAAIRLRHQKAFKDLTVRSTMFREKLLDEFRVFENMPDSSASKNSPMLDTQGLFPAGATGESQVLAKMLKDTPHQLVKFKLFKRAQEGTTQHQFGDKRLTRIKNVNRPPLGLWAHWVVQHDVFEGVVLLTIVLNSLLVGVAAELQEDREKYWYHLRVIEILDLIALMVFILEIVLKWMDGFHKFWQSKWNVFDFVITVLSALPAILDFFVSTSSGQSERLAVVARQLRLFRVLRTMKLLSRFTGLRIIVETIIRAFQSMTFIIVLLFLVAYIYAIMAINLFENYTYSEREDLLYKGKFRSIGSAMISLFQLMTLDQWFAVQNDFAKVVHPVVVVVFFLSWVFIGAFAFRNIFVGVMVKDFAVASERLAQLRREDRERAKVLRMHQRLDRLKRRQRQRAHRMAHGGSETDSEATKSGLGRPASFTSMSESVQSHREGPHTPRTSVGGSQSGLAEPVLQRLQSFYMASKADGTHHASYWESTMHSNMAALLSAKKGETQWPRDTLFRYFQCQQTLQENMREYEELQTLASWALFSLHDS